jgi:microcystin-dependent protein
MLELNPLAQPPAGSVTPADLYIDRASRQMWLGVTTAVDPTGSLLVADIVQTLAAIDAAEADAKAYADTQILTRAPLSHTHTSSQVTDFNSAVDARIAASPTTGVPVASVTLYSGPLPDIGVGPLASWMLCDGRSLLRSSFPALFGIIGTLYGNVDGTHFNLPNLTDRFVYGAGGAALPAAANVAQNLAIPLGGAHSHDGATQATTLTIAHLPSHTHSIPALSGSGSISGTANSAGAHDHRAGDAVLTGSAGGNGMRAIFGGTAAMTSTDGAHTHSVSGSCSITTSASNTGAQGSGTGHTHPIPSDAGHTHTVTAVSGAVRNALSWVALSYMIKVI